MKTWFIICILFIVVGLIMFVSGTSEITYMDADGAFKTTQYLDSLGVTGGTFLFIGFALGLVCTIEDHSRSTTKGIK